MTIALSSVTAIHARTGASRPLIKTLPTTATCFKGMANALSNVGDDFHVFMGVHGKTAAGLYQGIIPDPELAKSHTCRIVIISKTEMVTGIEPTVIGMTQIFQWCGIDQLSFPFTAWRTLGDFLSHPCKSYLGR